MKYRYTGILALAIVAFSFPLFARFIAAPYPGLARLIAEADDIIVAEMKGRPLPAEINGEPASSESVEESRYFSFEFTAMGQRRRSMRVIYVAKGELEVGDEINAMLYDENFYFEREPTCLVRTDDFRSGERLLFLRRNFQPGEMRKTRGSRSGGNAKEFDIREADLTHETLHYVGTTVQVRSFRWRWTRHFDDGTTLALLSETQALDDDASTEEKIRAILADSLAASEPDLSLHHWMIADAEESLKPTPDPAEPEDHRAVRYDSTEGTGTIRLLVPIKGSNATSD